MDEWPFVCCLLSVSCEELLAGLQRKCGLSPHMGVDVTPGTKAYQMRNDYQRLFLKETHGL